MLRLLLRPLANKAKTKKRNLSNNVLEQLVLAILSKAQPSRVWLVVPEEK
jgi:hypothetical protein